MTYLVGSDSPANGPLYVPANGAGGVLANYLQGSTPKYAKNAGFRADLFRDTTSRIFVRVDEAEVELFKQSVADAHVRDQLLGRLIGDPTSNAGYIDYVLSEMTIVFSENVQVTQTLGDSFIQYTFGQNPVTATFSGVLLNTVQDDQSTNMVRLYLEVLRASALARRGKAAAIKVDSYIFTGTMQNLQISHRAAMEVAVPFSFSFLIPRLAIVNYTIGWTPTAVGTPFSTDLNAVPIDARVGVDRAAVAVAFRIPVGTSEVGDPNADPRVTSQPPAPAQTNAARITELEHQINTLDPLSPEWARAAQERRALLSQTGVTGSASAPGTAPPSVATGPAPETTSYTPLATTLGAGAGVLLGPAGAVVGGVGGALIDSARARP